MVKHNTPHEDQFIYYIYFPKFGIFMVSEIKETREIYSKRKFSNLFILHRMIRRGDNNMLPINWLRQVWDMNWYKRFPPQMFYQQNAFRLAHEIFISNNNGPSLPPNCQKIGAPSTTDHSVFLFPCGSYTYRQYTINGLCCFFIIFQWYTVNFTAKICLEYDMLMWFHYLPVDV